MIAVEEFLDYGKDVFRRTPDFSVFHGSIVLFFRFFPFEIRSSNDVPAPFFCHSVSRDCHTGIAAADFFTYLAPAINLSEHGFSHFGEEAVRLPHL
ncbi:MAG: hypothetical protein K2I59_05915 [Alistipes sp.]|nr:hypothetical protein [Alistipes sp.]